MHGDAGVASAPEVAPKPDVCRPSVGGPYWLQEGDALLFALSCGTGLQLDGSRFTLDPMPRGASYDPGRGVFEWTPELDQASVYKLIVSVLDTGERVPLTISVADKFDDPTNTPIQSPQDYTEEFGLPVLHVATSTDLNADKYTEARITFRGHVYKSAAKLRGHSSADYPKRSLNLKFGPDDTFDEPLHGFRHKGKVAMTTTFDDNSHLRHRLAYEVWNHLDQGNIKMQNFSAVVYWAGKFAGVYAITDSVDDSLFESNGLSTSGGVFKAMTHAANFWPKPDLAEGYTKTMGLPVDGKPGAYDDLSKFVAFVANSSGEEFAMQAGRTFNVSDYQSWTIMTTAILGTDSFGKNSYHYHDPDRDLWRVIPWDFNASFGQNWDTTREPPTPDPVEIAAGWNYFFDRLLNQPEFGPATRARYRRAMAVELKKSQVMKIFDRMVAELETCALRDERLWRKPYLTFARWSDRTDFTDFHSEVAYMRRWIDQRWTFLEQKFVESPPAPAAPDAGSAEDASEPTSDGGSADAGGTIEPAPIAP